MTPAHVPALYLLCAPVSTNLFSLVFYSSLSLIFSPVQLQDYAPLFLILMSCVSFCYVNFFVCLFPRFAWKGKRGKCLDQPLTFRFLPHC